MIRTLATLVSFVLAGSVFAQTTWTGATSNSWNLASNWDNGVPNSVTDATVPGTATIFPSVFTGNPTTSALTIEAGATLTLSAGWDLTVNGDLLVDGTFNNTATSSNITVVGAWINNGSFSNGGSTVTLSGTGDLGGASTTTFHNLTISGGSRTCTAAFAAGADVEVEAGVSLDLASFTHSVSGNWTSSGVGAVVSGTGTLEFTGNGFLTTLANSVPNVTVSGGVRSVNSSVITADLGMSGGQIQILDFTTLTVGGDVSLTGGTLGWDGTFVGADVIDVAGSVAITASAGTSAADSTIRCGGDWSSSSTFAPASGVVELDGAGAHAIGGASPTFADLTVFGGTYSVNAATVVAGDLILASGAALVSAAALDVNGDVFLGNPTASWDLGAFTHTVAGDLSAAGASATGAGTIELDGTGALAFGAGAIANLSVTAGTRTVNSTTVSGDLSLSGTGVLEIGDNQTLHVQGSANLTGGTLQWFSIAAGGADVLDVDGDVTLTAAFGQGSANSLLRVAGSWSSSAAFSPTAGTVDFDGGTASVIGGASPTFHHLTISNGAESLTAPATVGGNFFQGSGTTLSMAAALDVAGNAVVNGILDVADQPVTVGGNWTGDFFGASVTATTGSVTFTADGTMITGANSLPDVNVTGGVRSVFISTVNGDLDVSGGTLEIQDNSTLTVTGSATLGAAATLAFDGVLAGLETLDVTGAVVLAASAGTMSSSAFIQCDGDWTSAGTWAPSAGTVRLGGGGVATVSATNFFNLSVDSGTRTFVTPCSLGGNLTVVSGATLDTDAALDVNGAVTLGNNTASWDLGGLTHTVAGNFTSSGASASGLGGTIAFDGPGTVGTSTGSIDNVLISVGVRTCNPTNLTVTGELDLTGSATLQIANDRAVFVGGNANLTSGTLAWFGTATSGLEVLDIEGDAAVTASYGGGSNNSRLRVAGNWSSSSSFAPTAGIVELDGAGATSISGTAPIFRSLVVMAGDKTLLATADVTGDLTVSLGTSMTLSLSDLTVGGNVLVDGTLDLGGGTAAAGGSWTSNGGSASVVGPGTLDLTGTGALITGANTLPDVIVSAGVRTAFDTTIVGSLDVTGGNLEVQDDASVTVSGNLTVGAGGVLGFTGANPGAETIDVEGDVTIAGSNGSSTANSVIRCAGNWSSDASFAPLQGEVVLDGALTNTLGGAAPSLADLRIASGVKTVTGATALLGDLTVDDGATLDADGALSIGGAVSLGNATATWDIGALTHTVVGDYTSAGADAVGSGVIAFTSTGTTITGAGSVPNVLLSGGVRLCKNSTIVGDVDVSAGSLRIDNDATVSVGGNLAMTGGVLEWTPNSSGGPDVLDVEGDVTLGLAVSSGLSSVNTRLRVAGNYAAEAGFAPANGLVELDGGSTTTVGGAPAFPNLRIVSGVKTLTAPASVGGDLTIDDGSTFDTDAAVSVGGDATLGDGTAAWDGGAATHTVSGSFVSAGASLTGGCTLVLGASGDLSTGGGTVDDVVVTGGTRSIFDATLLGSLIVTGGTLELQDNVSVDVAGSVAFGSGTTLAFDDQTAGAETLDVAGGVSMQGSAGAMTADSTIFCAGSWSANGNWAPSAGTVTLDGAGLTQLSGLSPDQTTAFFDLVLVNGAREVTGDMTLDVDSLLVDATAELRVGGNQVIVPGSTLTVDGRVDIDAGGELAMGPTAVMSVTASGVLSLIGVSGDRASIAGALGGGYALVVNGTIEANHYHFGGMGVNGVVFSRNATVAAAPNNMDVGLFDDPSSDPGSVLLNMYRTSPATFRYVDFDGAGTAAYNVTTLFGSPITFENSAGDFAGETHDNDPTNLVSWTEDRTDLLSFTATPLALGSVKLDWTTGVEVDALDFVILRGPSESGPFSNIHEEPATGPGTYSYTDNSANGSVFVYLLMERLTHGDLHLLGQQEVVLFGGPDLNLRANVARGNELMRGSAPAPVALSGTAPPPGLAGGVGQEVNAGPGGSWTDIQAALGAALGHDPVIVVAPGSYPAFTIRPGFTGTLRILADGTGPVSIDTAVAPLRIQDLPAELSVELAGLAIGALLVESNAGLVVIDEGSVADLTVASSQRVVVQQAVVGQARIEQGSTAAFGGGELTALALSGLSRARTAGLGVGPEVESGSTWVDVPRYPWVDAPDLVDPDESFPVLFRGLPDSPFAVCLSPGLSWWNPQASGQVGLGVLPLVDLGAGEWMDVRMLNANGRLGLVTELPVTLLGSALVLQMVNQDPATGGLDWSNAASIVVPGPGAFSVLPATPLVAPSDSQVSSDAPTAAH